MLLKEEKNLKTHKPMCYQSLISRQPVLLLVPQSGTSCIGLLTDRSPLPEARKLLSELGYRILRRADDANWLPKKDKRQDTRNIDTSLW